MHTPFALLLAALTLAACGGTEDDHEHTDTDTDEHTHTDEHTGTDTDIHMHTDKGDTGMDPMYMPGMEATTESGAVTFALTLSDGATVGTADVTLVATSAGKPATGLLVNLDATMPNHGHGTNAVFVAETTTAGAYVAPGLEITMAGLWEIAVGVNQKDATDDTAVFSFMVE